jgi:hypothetical protein
MGFSYTLFVEKIEGRFYRAKPPQTPKTWPVT